MKIGVIGTGNLSTSVISGAVRSGKMKGDSFVVFDLFQEKAQECCEKYGTVLAASPEDVAASCDIVMLAVKPKDFPNLLQSLAPTFEKHDPIVLSVAAGLTMDFLQSFLPYDAKMIRIMTNINAAVCGAMTAYCPNARITADEEAFMDDFCKLFGDAIKLEEMYFSQFAVLAGCVPAFAYKFIDEIARAGVQMGIRKDLSLRIAAQTVFGSAKVLTESDAHPYALIDRVCTPGGTTIEGIAKLDELAFNDAVHKAVLASYEKDCALSKH